jgi:SM-20-related protein
MLHTVPGFFDLAFCRRCREAMDQGTPEQAEVLGGGIEARPSVRSTTHVDVAPGVLADVERRLDAFRETAARTFGLRLTGREGAGFLRYEAGGFYRPHRDWADDSPWPEAARRRVAVVVFLNGSRAGDGEAGGFEGGTLRLIPDDPGEAVATIEPRAGMLVAFRADTLHEVTAVEHGTRDAVVDWYVE